MKADEILKLTAYFQKTFGNSELTVKALPKKNDTAELYLNDEFLGVIYRDEDEGELSYNLSMAILDIDL